MKVGELREKLSKLKKEQVIKLAVEFYKLVPKSKKEDYDLDGLINNPQDKKKAGQKSTINLQQLDQDINKFLDDAENQYYLIPNRVIPKKERPKWRFKVKRWYKELIKIDTKRTDSDIRLQSNLLSDLYEIMCESCGFPLFPGHDSFQSIGVDQTEFFKSVITLIQEAEGKGASVVKGINLILNNYLNHLTLYTELMDVFIQSLDVPDLKYEGIEITNRLLKELDLKSLLKDKSDGKYSQNIFGEQKRNNNLVKFGFKLYASLSELDEGIKFFKEHYYDENEGVKLYILVDLLFENEAKDRLLKEIEEASKKGIKLRQSLLDLMKEIKDTGELPLYMP